MTLTIGRVTLSLDPGYMTYDGDRLEMAGWFYGTTIAHAKVVREQMLGLDGNEDEPDVPVTWTGDAGIDGYYTIGSVNVTPVRGVTYQRFGFQYSAQLQRVNGGFAAPLCEVAASIAVRSNVHSVTTPTGAVSVPASSTFKRGIYGDGESTIPQPLYGSRVGASGNVAVFIARPTEDTFGSFSYATEPADHYDGAALIEQSVAGTWYPVVGDQIGNVEGNLMRVGNGLVRFTFHTDGVISSELFDGSVWESTTSFTMVGGIAGTWIAEGGWRVLKNAADACTVQTSASQTLVTGTRYRTVTIHVERGRMLAEFAADGLFFTRNGGITSDDDMDVRAGSVTASTTLTGGLRQTTNDANGHRWLMLSPQTITKDLVNGQMLIVAPGAPLVAQFALGWERNGSSSADEYDAVAIADEYFAVTGTRQRVVAR